MKHKDCPLCTWIEALSTEELMGVLQHWQDECVRRGILTEKQLETIRQNPSLEPLRAEVSDQLENIESTKQ